MWRNHIWKLKFTFHSEVLVSSWILDFKAFVLRDMKMAAREGCRVGQKMSFALGFANLTALSLEEAFISTCQSSRVIIFQFNSKNQRQMFLLLYGGHVYVPPEGHKQGVSMKLFKFGWHTSANNARMKNSRDLIQWRGCLHINHLPYIRFFYFIYWMH